jgi:hypothetical protein
LYGWENAMVDILLVDLTKEEANRLETHYIDTLETLAPNGYNLNKGGDCHEWSEETKKVWEESMKSVWNDPEYIRKRQEGIDRVNKDPKYNEKRSSGTSKYWENEENMRDESERRKLIWEDDKYRAKMKISLNTDEVKNKKSKAIKKCWEDLNYRDKTTSAIKSAMEIFRKFTDEEFLEANQRLNGKIPMLAIEFGASITTIKDHRKRLGLTRTRTKSRNS